MEFILNRQHDKTPETIALVEDLPSLEKEIGDFKSSQGTGGMQSKIEAAIAKAANIETWVVNGLNDIFYFERLKKRNTFTKIK
jgi:glutamate 5-kinase